jgi:hypothetical protein
MGHSSLVDMVYFFVVASYLREGRWTDGIKKSQNNL